PRANAAFLRAIDHAIVHPHPVADAQVARRRHFEDAAEALVGLHGDAVAGGRAHALLVARDAVAHRGAGDTAQHRGGRAAGAAADLVAKHRTGQATHDRTQDVLAVVLPQLRARRQVFDVDDAAVLDTRHG